MAEIRGREKEGLSFIQAVRAGKKALRNALSPENLRPECAQLLEKIKVTPSQLISAVNKIDYLDASQINSPFMTFNDDYRYPGFVRNWLDGSDAKKLGFKWPDDAGITVRELFQTRGDQQLNALALPKYTNTVLVRNLGVLTPALMAHEAIHTWFNIFDDQIKTAWGITGKDTLLITDKIQKNCF